MPWTQRLGLFVLLFAGSVQAGVDAAEAARLGTDLTPIGAEQAGVPNGPHGLSIPDWTGGWSEPGDDNRLHAIKDPFADEVPLFEIRAADVAKYADILTEAQKALFKQYPNSFRMRVFQSHRTAAFPEFQVEQTRLNATRVTLNEDGHGFSGSIHGFPFPVPKNGRELLWNHIGRFRTSGYRGYSNFAITTPNGDYVIERAFYQFWFRYNNPLITLEEFDNKAAYLLRKIVEPPNKAGDAALVHIPLDRVKDDTLVWVYNLGTRKVRRIGEIGYDNPIYDGLVTHDQVDMFNGPMDRYQFKVVGKKPMLVPYNCYQLHSPDVKYKDILDKGHIDPELVRYELHRVWVVEGTKLPGMNHIYKKRVFYVDEDSWLILTQDLYDERDEFWRAAESYLIQYPNMPLPVNFLQAHYDLQSRRYVMLNMQNEEKGGAEYGLTFEEKDFTTSRLKRFAEQRQR